MESISLITREQPKLFNFVHTAALRLVPKCLILCLGKFGSSGLKITILSVLKRLGDLINKRDDDFHYYVLAFAKIDP